MFFDILFAPCKTVWLVLSRFKRLSLFSGTNIPQTQFAHHNRHVCTPYGCFAQDEAGCMLFPHKDFTQNPEITFTNLLACAFNSG